jgi:AraC-like DNA-binding protein
MTPDFRIQDLQTALGRIVLGGQLLEHTGTPLVRDWQVRNTYSLACVRRGRGLYFDALGRAQQVETGAVIFTFPGLGHRYGPEGSDTWDECFLVFEGPIFDLCRSLGLMRPATPIVCLGSQMEFWCSSLLGRMEVLQAEPTEGHFLDLVKEMLSPLEQQGASHERAVPTWLAYAQSRLDRLDEKIEIEALAEEIGVAGRTLQRQFVRSTGLSPRQYRDERRLCVALELLTHVPGIKLRTVAHRVGFEDEFYFSRWFKRKMGIAPHQWRRNEPRH